MKFKRFSKKLLSILLSASLLASVCVFSANAVTTTCTVYSGTNIDAQNYNSVYSYNAADTIKSYLTKTASGELMRFQNFDINTWNSHNGDDYLVEYYDTNYNLLRTKTVAVELEKFGGFYATASNYYILSGQDNTNESEDVECYRITKYDLNWNRISSTGLYNCNTYKPFASGTARFDMCGKYLMIKTCHTMYAKNGVHHQANVTIEVDTDTMKITDSFTKVWNISGGYVSHSFNQFIKMDNNKIISVDHGDANPRSIVLCKYNNDASDGTFSGSCSYYNLITFPDTVNVNYNYTGAAIGGFEISSTSYLTVGNCVALDDNYENNKTRNIFVSVFNKSTNAIENKFVTNFAEGETTTKAPHFVKISDTRFLLMWTQGDDLYYTLIDENGNTVGSIKKFEGGQLSDCDPIITNGKAVWYTWENAVNTFYEIDLNTLKCNQTVIENGHNYVYSKTVDGYAYLKCSICGDEKTQLVPTSMNVWWNTTGRYGSYTSTSISSGKVGDVGHIWVDYSPSDATNDIEITSSDSSVIKVTPFSTLMADLEFVGVGTATITVSSKYNTSLKKSYNITVQGDTPNTTASTTASTADNNFRVWWNKTARYGTYYSGAINSGEVGDTIYIWTTGSTSSASYSTTVTSSDESVVKVNKYSDSMADFALVSSGTATITITSNIDKSIVKTYTITVTDETATTAAPTTEPTTVSEKVLIGDADLDGEVTVKDATLIQKYLVLFASLSDKALVAADTDKDSYVNIKDATNVQKYLAGFSGTSVGTYTDYRID